MADDIIIVEATIAFARLDNGHVIAASTASPYFCFEAEDEEAAKRKVEEAIAFYADAKRQIRQKQQPTKERQITVRRIHSYSRERRELQVA